MTILHQGGDVRNMSSYTHPRDLPPVMREAMLRLPLDTQRHLLAFFFDKKTIPELAAARGLSKMEMADIHLDALLSWRQKAAMLENGRPKSPKAPRAVQKVREVIAAHKRR